MGRVVGRWVAYRISSSRRASSRSCSAFSRLSHARLMSDSILPSRGRYGFWLLARMRLCSVKSSTSRLPFSTNLTNTKSICYAAFCYNGNSWERMAMKVFVQLFMPSAKCQCWNSDVSNVNRNFQLVPRESMESRIKTEIDQAVTPVDSVQLNRTVR